MKMPREKFSTGSMAASVPRSVAKRIRDGRPARTKQKAQSWGKGLTTFFQISNSVAHHEPMCNSMLSVAAPEKPRPNKVGRIQALDFTKGLLVLIMILYHWINYCVGPDWAYYKYLRFLTPSFIFVTGFLISNVLLSGYGVSSWRLSKRLCVRGLKLVGLFLFLNFAGVALLSRGASVTLLAEQHALRNLEAALTAGNTSIIWSGKIAAFYILVPIGYLLILTAGLAIVYRAQKRVFHMAFAFFLLCILVLYVNGLKSDNLEFVTVGLLGVLAGFPSIEKINGAINHPYTLAVAYACYIAAISVWNVPFPLLVVGVCLSVSGIYLLGLKWNDHSKLRNYVILLGQYSLFGYVAQIAILQLLSACLRHIDLGFASLGVSFLAAFTLTMVAVEAVAGTRAKSATFEKMYRAVFA
jgi:hypothetical protein